MWSRNLCALLLVLITSCRVAEGRRDLKALLNADVVQADGERSPLSALMGAKATVIITLDPDCPFCRGYAPLIDSLSRSFAAEGVRFVGLYPASFIAADSVQRFAGESGLEFPQVMDADCRIASALDAKVTPECFLLDARGELFYRGAIDNWAVRAGRHRVEATEHYLSDAVHAALGGEKEHSKEVEAVGCIVECERTGKDE